MYKLIIIILLGYLLTGCNNTIKTVQNIDVAQPYNAHNLSDENILQQFIKYSIHQFNETDSDIFSSAFISRTPSTIQQYYYIQIINLLTDDYNTYDFEILKNLIYEQNNQFILPIMLFILQNSDVFTEDEITELKQTSLNNIQTFDIDKTKESEYIYSSLILNLIDDYNIDVTVSYIFNKLQKANDTWNKIVYLYYYILLTNDSEIIHNEYLISILNDILDDYSIEDKHLTEIYYVSYLINYFKLNNTLNINQIDFLELMIADLNNVHSLFKPILS